MRKSLLVFSCILAVLQFVSTLPALDSKALTPSQDFNPNCEHGIRNAVVRSNGLAPCQNGINLDLLSYARAMLCEYPEKFTSITIECNFCTTITFRGKWTANVAVCKVGTTGKFLKLIIAFLHLLN